MTQINKPMAHEAVVQGYNANYQNVDTKGKPDGHTQVVEPDPEIILEAVGRLEDDPWYTDLFRAQVARVLINRSQVNDRDTDWVQIVPRDGGVELDLARTGHYTGGPGHHYSRPALELAEACNTWEERYDDAKVDFRLHWASSSNGTSELVALMIAAGHERWCLWLGLDDAIEVAGTLGYEYLRDVLRWSARFEVADLDLAGKPVSKNGCYLSGRARGLKAVNAAKAKPEP